jgi:ribosome-associated protein
MEPMDDFEEKSKSQLKREAHALQGLGEQLIAMKPAELDGLPLPDNLAQAIEDARSMQRGALKRQRQYIGKLMRDIDPEPIQTALDLRRQQAMEMSRQQHKFEEWRDRLIQEGDQALGEALEVFPTADRQQLRQMIRQAQKEAEQNKPPKTSRSLFRYLRDL